MYHKLKIEQLDLIVDIISDTSHAKSMWWHRQLQINIGASFTVLRTQ